MSEPKENGYMLIFRGTDWHKGLSAEESQQAVGAMMEWFKRLTDAGKVTAGQPLEAEGKVVSDGPFLESKEAIGGFFMLQVESMDEAVTIAKQCPMLAYGARVEVRQLASECPHTRQLKAEAQLASA